MGDVTPNADGAVTIVPHKLGRPWSGYMVTKQKYSGNESYLSTAVTPTASSFATLEHGLGAKPTTTRAYIVSLGTDHGYAVGDELDVAVADSGTASRGMSIYARGTTEIKWLIGSGGICIINTVFASAALATPANWSLYIACTRRRSLTEVSNKTSNADLSKYLYLRGAGFTGTDKVDIWVY